MGVLVAVAGLTGARDAGSFATSVSVGAVIAGVGVAATFFVIGVLIAAQGQLVMAVLDTAVNSSPFLTQEQRTQIMF